MNRSFSSSQKRRSWYSFFTSQTMTYVGIVLVALLSLYAVRAAYRWFDNRRQADAQEALMGVIQQFVVAQQDTKTDWQGVAKVIDIAYTKHEGTNAAPYLLALRADVYLAVKDHVKALETMNEVVAKSNPKSVITSLYKTKRALMLIDGDEQSRAQGVKELEALSNDATNRYSDQARYYLGMYYLDQGNHDLAQQIFKPLLDMPFDGEGGSVWAARARDKMSIA